MQRNRSTLQRGYIGIGFLAGLGLLAMGFWVGVKHAGLNPTPRSQLENSASAGNAPAAGLDYESFQETAISYLKEFRPPGIQLLYPQGELANSLTFFPRMQVDRRGIDAVDGDPLRPSRYDFFYHAGTGVLVQLSLIYAPWSDRREVIYWSALRNGLSRDFPFEYRDKIHLPYVLEGLIGQRGYLVRFTVIAANPGLSDKEATARVTDVYEPFVTALDDFMATHARP